MVHMTNHTYNTTALWSNRSAHALLRHKINEYNDTNPHQKIVYNLDKKDIIPKNKNLATPSTFMPSDSFIINDKLAKEYPIYSIVKFELRDNEDIYATKTFKKGDK